ncbi:hypothetical protein LG274_02725 [Micrococcus antarcticus]|uniref:hypothetical protein n=1 Tax=Micrococcus antarcticus TaxID=86171 RepID=UPI00384EB8CB
MPVNLPDPDVQWHRHPDGRVVPCHLYRSYGWDPLSVARRKRIGMLHQPFVTRATGHAELDMWLDQYTAVGDVPTWGLRFRQLSQEAVVRGGVAYAVGGYDARGVSHSDPSGYLYDDSAASDANSIPTGGQTYKSVMFTDGAFTKDPAALTAADRTTVSSTQLRSPLNNTNDHYFWAPNGTLFKMDRRALTGGTGLFFVSGTYRLEYRWPQAAVDAFAGVTGTIELTGFAYGNGVLTSPDDLRGGLVGYGADTRYVPKPGAQDDTFNEGGEALTYAKPYRSNVIL